jgi:phage tail protein X
VENLTPEGVSYRASQKRKVDSLCTKTYDGANSLVRPHIVDAD